MTIAEELEAIAREVAIVYEKQGNVSFAAVNALRVIAERLRKSGTCTNCRKALIATANGRCEPCERMFIDAEANDAAYAHYGFKETDLPDGDDE